MKLFFHLFIFLFLFSCTPKYYGNNICRADQFVIDSYKIKEGKYAILELAGIESQKLDSSFLKEYKDTISDDDFLRVTLYHPKRKDLMHEINNISGGLGFQVIEGKIYLPDLDPIYIQGLTLLEAKKKIEDRYNLELSEVEVFLGYKNRQIKKVELAGMVAFPSFPVDGKVRLFEVLSAAKIPTDANLFKSYVLRNNEVIPVDLVKLMKDGDMSQNIVLRGGDKIYIAEPSSATAMVMGEVRTECVIALPSGSISLRKAIAIAKGIPYTGDKSHIQIIRGNILNPKIYVIKWEHVMQLSNESMLLMPGDIVYVSSKPITKWNRFITQILPSFAGLDTFAKSKVSLGVFIP